MKAQNNRCLSVFSQNTPISPIVSKTKRISMPKNGSISFFHHMPQVNYLPIVYNISISTTYPKAHLSTKLCEFLSVDIFPSSTDFTRGSAILLISKIRRTLYLLHFRAFYFSTFDIITTVSTWLVHGNISAGVAVPIRYPCFFI